MNCLLCEKPILDNQSRVTTFIVDDSDGVHHSGRVGTCHRSCAAAKWPDVYQDRPAPTRLSLCESVTASSISPWCIRPLTETGKHLGGAVDTQSLCGRVRPPYGWDLALDYDEYMSRGGSKVCKRCLDVLRAS